MDRCPGGRILDMVALKAYGRGEVTSQRMQDGKAGLQ